MYCGTALPAVAEAPLPARDLTIDERFEALARHPDVPRILASPAPSGAGEIAGGVGGAVFGIIFAGIAVFIMSIASSAEAPAFFMIFVLIFIVVGVLAAGGSLFKTAKFASAPLRKLGSLVADERTVVSGGGKDSSASTTYYVLLQFRDGQRAEYRAPDRVAGKVAPGDLGIAFLRGNVLLDFRRVPV